MKTQILTDDQRAALLTVQHNEGRCWKQELRLWWYNGNYPSYADSGELQRMRNDPNFDISLKSVKL